MLLGLLADEIVGLAMKKVAVVIESKVSESLRIKWLGVTMSIGRD